MPNIFLKSNSSIFDLAINTDEGIAGLLVMAGSYVPEKYKIPGTLVYLLLLAKSSKKPVDLSNLNLYHYCVGNLIVDLTTQVWYSKCIL